jgi:hypothetical protein
MSFKNFAIALGCRHSVSSFALFNPAAGGTVLGPKARTWRLMALMDERAQTKLKWARGPVNVTFVLAPTRHAEAL